MFHNDWLFEQSDSLKNWLQKTNCPLFVAREGGEILWVNRAFEDLLGYTSIELIGIDDTLHGKTWTDLTVDKHDLHVDKISIQQLINEEKEQYSLQKAYMSKGGKPIDVIVQVLRWPVSGSAVSCFLVTVTPVDKANEYLVERVKIIEKLLEKLISESISTRNRPTNFDKFWSWVSSNKLLSTFLGILIGSLLFGDRVIELFDKLIHGHL